MKQLREGKQLTLIAVAKHIDVAESSVRNWEHGRSVPKLRIDQFSKLLQLYGCSFEELRDALNQTLKEAGS